jgi:magnesium transporter
MSAMLRAYGPGCDGSIVEAKDRIPNTATWIDLEEPTKDEEALVERCVHLNVPTKTEMAEIEPSSRLYERNGALYMTVSVLSGVVDGQPTTTPIGFVLSDNRLVTIRYATPKPVRAFTDHVGREPDLARDATTVLIRMLDAIIDRLADELEALSGDEASQTEVRHHLASLSTDVTSLSEHASFLSDNLTFLLDASLGLISIEQNAAMKLFSWAALVFLPPTLIAGVFGMNFHHMPELDWAWGYPVSLVLILASAVLPIWYLKRRGWI